MNPFEQMELKRSVYTATDMQVYECVKNNIDSVLRETATSFAESFHISQPALTRFCQKLGYKGFSDFRSAVYQYHKSASMGEEPASTVDYYCKVLKLIPAAMEDADIDGLVEHLILARSVCCTGFHKSSLPARLLYLNLVKFGILAYFSPYDEFSANEQTLSDKDVLVVFSAASSAYKPDLARMRERPREDQPFTALITMSTKHPVRNHADQIVWLPNYQNQNYNQYLESQISFMVFVDLLTNAVAQRLSV